MTDDGCHGANLRVRDMRVLDESARGRFRYLEFAPPEDLATWLEAISVVYVPARVPRRAWCRLPDARARIYLPVGGGLSPLVWVPDRSPRLMHLAPAGLAAVIRLTPWAWESIATAHTAGSDRGAGLGTAAARWMETLVSPDPIDMFRAAERWIRDVLPQSGPERIVGDTWYSLCSPGWCPPVHELAERVGVSERTLERRFVESTGLSPRGVRSLERFRFALRILRRDLNLPWAGAAVEAGYYDQSHFIRIFRKYAGMPPGRFFAEGHHHANEVFARAVDVSVDGLRLRAVGVPVLRREHPLRFPNRHRRRRSPERTGS